jgi:SAM-dependent methyltransferase
MSAPGFNDLLHELRGAHLRRMPPGAATFLSAGCAGSWYFRWIAENYPGIRRHVGVEAYSPRPSDLPDNAEWISASVSDMRQVPSESVDLVFSGQNIEHLLPADVRGFLAEARRVLRPGGWLVLDSPNRAITERVGWFQPEHVVEFRVDEITQLVELAGFDVESIRGLWQCYDPVQHRLLPLDPRGDDTDQRRVACGETDPENSFVWWLTARRSEREGDFQRIDDVVRRAADEAFSTLPMRFKSQVGSISYAPLMAEARGDKGRSGCLLYGPYVALFPGRYRAVFRLRVLDPSSRIASLLGARLGHVDVSSFYQKRDIALREFKSTDLARPGEDGYCCLSVSFDVRDALFGAEFRVFTTGHAALGVAVPVQLDYIS